MHGDPILEASCICVLHLYLKINQPLQLNHVFLVPPIFLQSVVGVAMCHEAYRQLQLGWFPT